ncbi:MAG TPA: FIST N-terminal domain-containing protein, partial [Candidatus Dormibacteraeota bacterium]|nr:FIST N-terminal domain-containing protein [Candidatus Dormibacteraeota bacterium]
MTGSDSSDLRAVASATAPRPEAADRWFAVGTALVASSRDAGRRATAEAVRHPDAKLLVVFASAAHDLEELLAGIRDVAPDVPLIGCSTAGEIAVTGPSDSGVAVVALGGEGFDVATASASCAGGRLREAGAEVAECVSRVPDRAHRALLLLTDGLAGNQAEVVRGAYSVLGAAVPLVGGCAGDDLEMKRTFQLIGSEVLNGAVVGAVIASDAPIGIGVEHGWRKVGEPMLVTSSESNRVLTLDDRPALDVYLERLAPPEAAQRDEAAFTRFAMTHPLGLNRRAGEEVRFIASGRFEDRSIECIAEVPQGGLAWFMEGDDASVLEATDAACAQALGHLDGRAPLGFLAFDCIARRGVLGDEGIQSEVS